MLNKIAVTKMFSQITIEKGSIRSNAFSKGIFWNGGST